MAIVGAGLVGLATAIGLLERRPALSIAIIEKEKAVGQHQSSHNSGVVHSGLYYQPGSLKAQLCVEGKRLLEEFAERVDIPVERCGKLVVALTEDELPRLAELRRRGEANGVVGLRDVTATEMKEIEPSVSGIRGLHVASTAIIDFAAVARAYAADVVARRGTVLLGRRMTGASPRRGEITVATDGGELRTRLLITCAGLYSDMCAANAGTRPGVRIVPFRGDFYTVAEPARRLVRHLIYPVPDPSLPFLGVHLTRRIDGQVWAGPNAVLALAREGYTRTTIRPSELAQTLRFPGFWRMARSHWRTGAREVWRDTVTRAYVRQLQRYVPDLRAEQLTFGPSGVRAQAVGRDGRLVDDFVLEEGPHVLHVLNAPSPAATASLAIGRRLAARAADRLD